jgi:tetratricopeptide (TPR) repeat protein
MATTPDPGPQDGRGVAAPERLDSWKAIADHLGRHISTVQRWEREEGLPVLRHVHDKRGSVYAHAEEIDAWLQGRSRARAETPAPVGRGRWLWRAAAAFALVLAAATVAPTRQSKTTPTPDPAPAPSVSVASSEALAEYRRGRSLWNRRRKPDFALAAKYYTRALARDPALGLAYVGLADTYVLRTSGLSSAESRRQGALLATKALELDPASGEAMASLAKLRVRAWDWRGAEAGFLRAIEHAPEHAPAHYWYASLLAYHRRCDEAREHVRDAERLEPTALTVQHVAVLADLACGDMADADRRLAVMREFDPAFPPTYSLAGRALLARGDVSGAIATLEAGVTATDNAASARAQLAFAYARGGQVQEAMRIADALERERILAPDEVPAWGLALVSVGLRQTGDALKWLERAYDAQEDQLRTLAIDERFASLYEQRGFRRLLRLLRLPDPAPPSLREFLSMR